MAMRRRIRAGIAMGLGSALGAGGLMLPLATTDAASAATAPAAVADRTITPNPWYAGDEFEGWGTSLVWFANATGGYPEELREQLYQAVFGEDGLNLNIARYNIGGGNASDVEDYLRAGGAVEGYWAEDPTGAGGTYGGVATTYEERDALLEAWDPDDPAAYDWSADETQRWWVERLAEDDQITHWETFANSAPYFMTESGYVSGGFDASAEQLKPEADEKFVAYLARVTEFLEEEYGIEVDTIDPFNEPNTDYWGTTLRDGVAVGGRQEGMHVGPQRQVDVIRALAAELADTGTSTDAVISAMDETNPDIFARNWAAYPADVRDMVQQMNVHTYGTSGRLGVRDLAKQDDSRLWMSEIEGSWVTGWDPTNIENGLGIAGRVMDDLRELEPNAWVLWQPVEDLYNMQPQGEDLNWGSVFIDLDCAPYEEDGETLWKSQRRVADAGGDSTLVEECEVQTNTKFDTLRNFTTFIRPGDRLVAVNDVNSTAAVTADGRGATIVHRNTSTDAQTIDLDLSGFAHISDGAAVTPYVTTGGDASGGSALVPGQTVTVDPTTKSATVTVPAKSVTSFVIEGVSGVAEDAPGLRDGRSYQLIGTQSGKALTGTDGATATTITSPAASPEAAARQQWTVHEVPAGDREAIRRVVLQNGEGRVLAATRSGTELRALEPAAAAEDPASRWIVNTTDGQAFTLVNESVALSLDVGGQSTADDAAVGVYGSNGGANQSWQPRDLSPLPDQTVTVRTDAGVPPALPGSIPVSYPWGTGGPAAVEWTTPDDSVWDQRGQVHVSGTATDVFGQTFPVLAVVDVGGLTVTDPVSLTVAEGSSPDRIAEDAPTTVPARVGASSSTFDVPVAWDFSALPVDAPTAGTVLAVPGEADADGTVLPASLSVIVTESTPRNVAPDPGVTASATFTEPGYSADATRNGVTTDKAWSNWVASGASERETLTYEFETPHDLSGARVFFYADGSSQSWARSLRFEYRADGLWSPVPGHENGVEVIAPEDGTAPIVAAEWRPVSATGLRVVMDAHPDTHMVVSEVEILEPAPGVASVSSLAALRLDGVGLDGFAPDTTAYDVTVDGSRYPAITAIPTDRNATVRIDPPGPENDGVGTVTVAAEDGRATTAYTVDVERRVLIRSVTIAGEVREGSPVSAIVDVDPSEAAAGTALGYTWLLDGAPVESGEIAALADDAAARFTVPADAGGALLSVRVTARADGYADAEPVTSGEISVAEAVTSPPADGAGEDGSGGAGDNGTGDAGSGGGQGPGAGPGADAASPSAEDLLAGTGGSPAAPLFAATALLVVGLAAIVMGARRRARR